MIRTDKLSEYYGKAGEIKAVDELDLAIDHTVDEIIAKTGTKTLEEAFIAITGGVEEKELLAWREQSGAVS